MVLTNRHVGYKVTSRFMEFYGDMHLIVRVNLLLGLLLLPRF